MKRRPAGRQCGGPHLSYVVSTIDDLLWAHYADALVELNEEPFVHEPWWLTDRDHDDRLSEKPGPNSGPASPTLLLAVMFDVALRRLFRMVDRL